MGKLEDLSKDHVFVTSKIGEWKFLALPTIAKLW